MEPDRTLTPTRSRDELLNHVARRASVLRVHRRAARLVPVSGVVALVAVLAFVSGLRGDGEPFTEIVPAQVSPSPSPSVTVTPPPTLAPIPESAASPSTVSRPAELGGDVGVRPLLRADGWRDAVDSGSDEYLLVEVAYDRATAQRAWEENSAPGLPRRDGEASDSERYGKPGVFGALEDVNFSRQAVVVVSWANSPGDQCATYPGDLWTGPDGRVSVRSAMARPLADGDAIVCDPVYLRYRMLLAVDRDRLPAEGDLPTVTEPSHSYEPPARVVAYPAG